MAFLWDDILGAVAGPLVSGLFGMGSSYTSAKMEYAQTKEGQERQYQYNKLLNSQQFSHQKSLNSGAYKYQSSLNKQAYNYQTLLNKTANEYSRGLMDYEQQLTTAQNQWNALNLPALNRQGYENAGINPMLAINSQSPAQMIGATGVSGGQAPVGSSSPGSASGSSVGGAPGAKLDLLRGITDAYRTFNLDRELNKAEVKLKDAQTEKVREEMRLLKYDKPLKVIGDVIENFKDGKLPPLPNLDVKGSIAPTVDNFKNGLSGSVNTAKKNFKSNVSKSFWHAYDKVYDKYLYFDHLRRYGSLGHPSWHSYDGSLSKYKRTLEGKYHYKQLFRK